MHPFRFHSSGLSSSIQSVKKSLSFLITLISLREESYVDRVCQNVERRTSKNEICLLRCVSILETFMASFVCFVN